MNILCATYLNVFFTVTESLPKECIYIFGFWVAPT